MPQLPEYSIERIIPGDEVIGIIRATKMMLPNADGTFTQPYLNADISIETFTGADYLNLLKTSLYVARDTLGKQRHIHRDIATEGFHPAELEGGLVLNSTDAKGNPMQTNFIPPVVEESADFGRVLMDGSHRDWLRIRENKGWMNVIRIVGVELPSYAWPNSRDAVRVYSTAPSSDNPHLKKWYANLPSSGGDVTSVINPRTGQPFQAGETIPRVIDPRTNKTAVVAELYRAIPNGSKPRNKLPGQ